MPTDRNTPMQQSPVSRSSAVSSRHAAAAPSLEGGYERWSHQDQELIKPISTGSSQINVGPGERLLSLVAGSALFVYGLRRSHLSGMALAAAGGALLFRGASGYCALNAAMGRNSAGEDVELQPIEIEHRVTINRPKEQVYRFWRKLENLPSFMSHLKEVKQLDARRSHWVARMPNNMGILSWDAEITTEIENERLSWQSVPHALVDNAGFVRFAEAANGQGTEVEVRILYRPPAGAAGVAIGRALNPLFARMIRDDLQRFKQVVEGQANDAAQDLSRGAASNATATASRTGAMSADTTNASV